ncbi:MAG: universal stress protein [Saprospiraceae bacterium]|nr:universal stress protein [Saprospiraceae bacterium]
MKRAIEILVPLDFSPCSENALEFAIRLAEKMNANIQVLNVPSWDSRGGTDNPALAKLVVDELIENSRKRCSASILKCFCYTSRCGI